MIAQCLLMLAFGAFAKLTDNLVDLPSKKSVKWLPYLTAVVYGLAAGFLVAGSPEFSAVAAAIIIGVLLAGKIDAKPHQIAVAVILAMAFFSGLPALNPALTLSFAALVFLDEKLNDLADRAKEKGQKPNHAAGKAKEKRQKLNHAFQRVLGARVSLGIGALAFGVASSNPAYFAAVLCFDFAYIAVDKAMHSAKRSA